MSGTVALTPRALLRIGPYVSAGLLALLTPTNRGNQSFSNEGPYEFDGSALFAVTRGTLPVGPLELELMHLRRLAESASSPTLLGLGGTVALTSGP